MFKKFFIRMQYILPHHLLAKIMGRLADCQTRWFKNFMINRFIKQYDVNLSEAVIQDPSVYPDFNRFFIRKLKPEFRPIAPGEQTIACPVDGCITQFGKINKNQLLQAKDIYYDLTTLLGIELAKSFYDGSFMTLYLAPNDYHRVHMPVTGKLTQTLFVPGKLFSVNRMTSELIPNLFTRNERYISIFDTEAGRMAVILVGAMFVGSIQTVWMDKPVRGEQASLQHYRDPLILRKGEELGYFKMGSTVILLFQSNSAEWSSSLHANASIQLGKMLGNIIIQS